MSPDPEVSGGVGDYKAVPLRAGAAIEAGAFAEVRRRAMLEGCKWDPQVGDIATLAPFPLILKAGAWGTIAALAEQLAAETVAAEAELLRTPRLHRELGLPGPLRRLLARGAAPTPSLARVMRFDFHPTTEGWQISEVNSDVPGGFAEGSHFTALMAGHFPEFRPAGDHGLAWGEALAAALPPAGAIVLLSAPGYMEDQQVVAWLAARLREQGLCPWLAKPEQIRWREGRAALTTSLFSGPLDGIVRFYQAEWLARLPRGTGWPFFFFGGKTPVANPGFAILSESKRFPLVWDKLSTALPAWRALLPETRDPRDVPWQREEGWVLKTAFCNTGDTITMREFLRPSDWLRTGLAARWRPGNWVAQRRFDSIPIATPAGPRHACVGVYTVNGRRAGAYARLAVRPIIDFAATDVALLLEDDE